MFTEIDKIQIRTLLQEFKTMEVGEYMRRTYVSSGAKNEELYYEKFMKIYSFIFFIGEDVTEQSASKFIMAVINEKSTIYQSFKKNARGSIVWNMAYIDVIELFMPILNICFAQINMR